MSERSGRALRRLLPFALLAALTAALYAPVLGLFFTKDDPAILAHVERDGLTPDFTSPGAWQAHNRLFFTPLLNASLAADLAVWGLRAAPYYAHHLLALLLAASLLLAVLERRVPRPLALWASAAFLAGVAPAEVTTQLMSRHYLEGLALALGAVLLWDESDRRDSAGLSVAAGALCVLAAAAKEVYAPLPLFLLLLPAPAPRGARRILPIVASLALALGWRTAMLGGLGRSYAPGSLRLDALPGHLSLLVRKLPESILGLPAMPAAVLLVALLAAALPYVASRRRRLAAFLGACALVLGPILPVAPYLELGARYVLVGWTLLVALCALVAGTWWSTDRRGRAATAALLAVLSIAALAGGRPRFARSLAAARREGAEGRFYLGSREADVLLSPAAPIWYFQGLAELRATHGPPGRAGVVVNDDIFFCGPSSRALGFRPDGPRDGASGAAVFAYSEATRSVRAEEPQGTLERERACRSLVEAPLSVSVAVDSGLLTWSFGPHEAGTYGLVFLVPATRFDLPRSGTHQVQWMPVRDTLAVRVRYASPEGWVTYSPELREPMREGRAALSWSRP